MKTLVVVLLLILVGAAWGANAAPLDAGRVAQIEALLPAKPTGVGPRITDRAAWEKAATLPAYQRVLTNADKYVTQAVPEQPDSLFLVYSQTGDRDRWQTVAFDRRGRFCTLVLAECLRNDGRYIPKIVEFVDALCAENTWMYPAHDGDLKNFHRQAVDIDLGASTLGFNMATAYWMLGDKLPAAARQLIVDNLNRRIVEPFKERYTGQAPLWWWMTTEMNWNSVCLAGSVGTALAVVPDRRTRAEFVAAGELYSAYFLKGFPADGYCTEGLGYWNYGFGRYVMLSETVRRVTGGEVDLLARSEARVPARFGERIQIINAVSPAFADCPVNAKPDHNLMHLLDGYFHLGLPAYAQPDVTSNATDLATEAIYRLGPGLAPATGDGSAAPYRLRDYFDKTGILIGRPPAAPTTCRMGVALKGGSNHESHNHNDVGSYVVVVGDKALILDPGPERYTARTFSAKRYDSKLINSFGHDVPMVAGQLQHQGDKTDAKVLRADFTDTTDTLSLDISPAYAVKDLTGLTRTWVYSRNDAGSLTVTDRATFSSPQSFGTALLTASKWSTLMDGRVLLEDGTQAVFVKIAASGPYSIDPETIRENAAVTPTRLGINLKEKSASATITLTITPR